MRLAKRAVVARSDPIETVEREGELMYARFRGEHDRVLKAALAFNEGTAGHLRTKSSAEQAAFVKGMIQKASTAFQPWAMEILFALGLSGRARFTELQRLLGISSRTLSDKLQALRDAGFVDREIFDEQPIRIEYFLTKRGTRVAVLAGPMFCELDRAVAPREKRASP